MRALHNNGVDPQTRKIIDAEGAIPYIENIPLEGIEQFREQVELIDMINTTDPVKIAVAAKELSSKNPGVFAKGAMWVEFKVTAKKASRRRVEAGVILLPEYGATLDSNSSLVTSHRSNAIVVENPSLVAIEVQDDENGTILFGREV
jgi:tetrahydromethanopterin S-methyltransferase subunit A